MNVSSNLLETLAQSSVYRDFERAFHGTTGLPMSFRAVESWQLPLHGKRGESQFCAIMAGQSHSCAHCLQARQKLADSATDQPATIECGAGISESAVPVRAAGRLIGFLHTGQVFHSKPTAGQFDRAAKLVSNLGLATDVAELKAAYASTPVVASEPYAASLQLLSIFAQQLSLLAGQLLEQARLAEPPVITRAKHFIQESFRDDLSLPGVAKECHTSTFYFCKLFKRHTGVNFTEYLSSVRIEKAKNLLLNRELTISAIAYEVGFQSLTHFNRVFKKTLGESPTQYRSRLPDHSVTPPHEPS
jgi:AraC-like DNA-binding protein/ligand-binding sensor protein